MRFWLQDLFKKNIGRKRQHQHSNLGHSNFKPYVLSTEPVSITSVLTLQLQPYNVTEETKTQPAKQGSITNTVLKIIKYYIVLLP